MVELSVDLGERSYPIFIGAGLLKHDQYLLPYIQGDSVLVVSNSTIEPLYLDKILEKLTDIALVDSLILPDGEKFKTLDTVNLIFDRLLEKRHNRKTTLIALGGGVIGDMVGFAAACYQRGVNFIQVPTTLLSQVDSSVGGKTGVNHRLGKNMIGAFYQPQSVVIDINVLATLPKNELSAGMAEVIKYGLIYDYDFFCWLEENIHALMNLEEGALIYAIQRSCEIKAEVVANDEREAGLRAILNLGHTFGHAIEAHQGYGNWLHGEAVGAGMVMACNMSYKLGWIDEDVLNRSTALIKEAGLPIEPPKNMSRDTFLRYMKVDKKNIDNSIRLVLLKACGKAVITSDYPLEVLYEVLG